MKTTTKRILSLALCLALALTLLPPSSAHAAGDVAINATNFPDANFRAYVSEDCDLNGDGKLSASELANIRTIGCNSKNISSLQGIDYPHHTFRDERDGQIYYYQTVDKMDWMAQNLAYDGYGYSYYDCDVMDDLFGRYYSWNDAVKACPEGWRLPTNEEFLAFHNHFAKTPATVAKATFPTGAGVHIANAYFNGNKMWEYWPDVSPDNTSGLSLLPLGYISIRGDEHAHLDPMQYTLFWTGDEFGQPHQRAGECLT